MRRTVAEVKGRAVICPSSANRGRCKRTGAFRLGSPASCIEEALPRRLVEEIDIFRIKGEHDLVANLHIAETGKRASKRWPRMSTSTNVSAPVGSTVWTVTSSCGFASGRCVLHPMQVLRP